MSAIATRSAYLLGLRDAAPLMLVVFPFGMVFGVVASEAGLNLLQTGAFSSAVIAGAAQLTALQMMQDSAPLIVAVASALAVNLRLAMYSAAMTPHVGEASAWKRALVAFFLVDQTYALAAVRFDLEKDLTLSWKLRYFAGTTTPTAPGWLLGSLLGAVLGDAIPGWLPLEVVVPIAFVSIIAPALRTGAHVAAAMASMVLALCFAWLPYNLGLMVAGLGGMMTGARVELWVQRARA